MKPVTQTREGAQGNCLQAALASVTGRPLGEVPDFAAMGKGWLWELLMWCRRQGLNARFTRNRHALLAHRGPAIVQGQSDRGLKHAVVYDRGRMVHDPHPSRAGLKTVEDAILL